jgi:hypothetical protein
MISSEAGYHKGRVDDLAEAELLGEVVGAAEECRRRRLAVDQLQRRRNSNPSLNDRLILSAGR